MGFMVDGIALGQVFFLVMRCSPVNIVLGKLLVHSSVTQVDSGHIRSRCSIQTVVNSQDNEEMQLTR